MRAEEINTTPGARPDRNPGTSVWKVFQTTYMWLGVVLALGVLSTFSFLHLASVDPPELGDSIRASTTDPVPFSLLALLLSAFIALLLMVGGCGKQFGLYLPQRPRPKTVFLGCTLLSFGTLLLSGVYLTALIEEWLGGAHESDIGSSWGERPASTRFLLSLSAGMYEEIIYVAMPAGFVLLFAWLASKTDRSPARFSYPSSVLWLATGASGIFILVRVAMHTYQGWASALAVVFWAAGQLAIFRYGLSVWPLVIAHFAFDFFVAGGALWPRSEVFTIAVIVVSILGGSLLLVRGAGRRRIYGRPSSRIQGTTHEGRSLRQQNAPRGTWLRR